MRLIPSRSAAPRRLVIETDVFSDVDDVGAISLAHALTDLGAADIAAVMVNTPSRWGPLAVEILNASLGRSGTPVGAMTPSDDSEAERDYARQIVDRFADATSPPRPQLNAIDLWRRVLATAEDGELTVVSIGFFGNLCRLLASGPDEHSPRTGRELVRRKVAHTVVMGGTYPSGREFNFAADPAATAQFLAEWPGPIDFVGWNVGVEVITGGTAIFDPRTPAGLAYETFCGADRGRESWDLIAVHFAAEPQSSLYTVSEPGVVTVTADGSNTWRPGTDGPHRLVGLAVEEERVSSAIDELLRNARSSTPRD